MPASRGPSLLKLGAIVCTAVVATSALAGLSLGRAQESPVEAVAVLRGVDGNDVGVAWFTQQDDKVLVRAAVHDLPPGFHGIHMHAVGDCDAATGFVSAGAHINPHGMTHPLHAGDMPTLLVNNDRTALASLATDRLTVADLLDADGSALIIHADADNHANIPTRYVAAPDETTLGTGDAGGRLACGRIELVR